MAKCLTVLLLLAHVHGQDAQPVPEVLHRRLGGVNNTSPPLEVLLDWEPDYPDGYVLCGKAAGTKIATLTYVMLRRRMDMCMHVQL